MHILISRDDVDPGVGETVQLVDQGIDEWIGGLNLALEHFFYLRRDKGQVTPRRKARGK